MTDTAPAVTRGRPDDIPEDVWRRAEDLAMRYIHWLGPVELDPQAEYVLTQSIARAILAERTRLRVYDATPRLRGALGLGDE